MAMATLMRLSLCEEISLSLSPSLYGALFLSLRWSIVGSLSTISALVSLSSLSRGKKMRFELCTFKYVGLCVYLRRTFSISRA
ncbi:hypothetical protein AMTRI_Chr12g271930 [Amborella trichopoda]